MLGRLRGHRRDAGQERRRFTTPRSLASAGVASALALALVPPAIAPADDTPSLLGINVSRGHVQLLMYAPTNSTITFSEVIDGARVKLGDATAVPPATGGPNGAAEAPVPIPWRCDRTLRRFHAIAHATDGRVVEATNEAMTPDCRDRVAIVAPKRVEPGATISVTLKDRWQFGDLPVRACTSRTKGSRSCSSLRFEPAQRTISFTRAAGSGIGEMDIDVVVAGFHQHHKVGIGRAPTAPKRQGLLITGDSMMQGIDAILAEKLKSKYRVIRQTRPGTGISKNLGKKWTVLAREQATRHKPAATVVLLGGNDGFPMTTIYGSEVKCCGEAWRAEYLERLKAMATAYARGGRGTVIWSLLPPTRREDLTDSIAAVNDAIRRLAAAMPQVRLVPLDKLFGPGYRDVIDGEKVRDPDGLHFSLPGQRIAANAILAALRASAKTAGS
jgi:lysophospholipase L1-like esterase